MRSAYISRSGRYRQVVLIGAVIDKRGYAAISSSLLTGKTSPSCDETEAATAEGNWTKETTPSRPFSTVKGNNISSAGACEGGSQNTTQKTLPLQTRYPLLFPSLLVQAQPANATTRPNPYFRILTLRDGSTYETGRATSLRGRLEVGAAGVDGMGVDASGLDRARGHADGDLRGDGGEVPRRVVVLRAAGAGFSLVLAATAAAAAVAPSEGAADPTAPAAQALLRCARPLSGFRPRVALVEPPSSSSPSSRPLPGGARSSGGRFWSRRSDRREAVLRRLLAAGGDTIASLLGRDRFIPTERSRGNNTGGRGTGGCKGKGVMGFCVGDN